jgi:hypothetical protein
MMRQSRLKFLCALAILLALPRCGWAQFNFITNADNTIAITGYTGAGGEVIIPDSTNGFPVTTIGGEAFIGQTLTSVMVPDSVKSIGVLAFAGCSGLTSVVIGSGVNNIGSDAFYNCAKLTNITVNTTNPSYASANGALFDKGLTTLIQFPASLAGSYVIPSSVITIAGYAFSGCTGLTNVTVPDSVISIGNGVFEGCSALRNVMIPSSVVSVGGWAFVPCTALTNISVEVSNANYASAAGVLFDKALTVLIQYPGGLSGSYAIPQGVTSIGDVAFGICSSLTTVTIPNSVTNIGNDAFVNCSNLTSLTIPDSVLSIGNGALSGCTGLTNATIGNGVKNIPEGAFAQSTGLTSVIIGNGVTNIGTFAFYLCSNLKSVVFGINVSTISSYAFDTCTSLTTVTFPNTVNDIGDWAFYGCSSLHAAYFRGDAPTANGSGDYSIFDGETGTAYYLPGTTGWSTNFGGWPTAQWFQPQPQILGSAYGLGAGSNGFQFIISWATNAAVVVEASTNLQNWTPVITNTLVSGTNAFADAAWTNYPQRFYRVRSP